MSSELFFLFFFCKVSCNTAVVDPGFPVGGRRPRSGGANSRGGYILKNLYVKRKNLDPWRGGAPAAPPGSANE